ncbi:hypothetical protein NL676_028189 [Syzygium grande]|nr:hypothetical protein NL676_028189 [Syzygium grande]
MASAAIGRASLPLLLSAIVLQWGFLPLSVDARPCKTLLIAYSFSFTGNPASLRHHQHPHMSHRDHPFPAVDFATARPLLLRSRLLLVGGAHHDLRRLRSPLPQRRQRSVPRGIFDLSSLRDRTVDILSVVVALLFGVGCGALTAATMYLVWSLFASHRGDDFQEESDDDEVVSPKKMGYVKIPAADAFPAPAKA